MEGTKRVLVVRLSSLGDILLCIPAVKLLKKEGFFTSWLLEYPIQDFLCYQDFVDEVIYFPRRELEGSLKRGRIFHALKIFSNFFSLLKRRRYEILLDFHGNLKSAFFSFFARAEKKIGLGKAYAKEKAFLFYRERIEGKRRIHKIERNLQFLKYLGIDGQIPEISLSIPYEKERRVEKMLKGIEGPIVVVNPFSSERGRFKRWAKEKYIELMKRIKKELNAEIVLIFGPKEKKEAEFIFESLQRRIFLPPLLSLFELLALFKRSRLYIGGDSGIMHLASFSDIKILTIFGPTDHLVNGPYSKDAVILRKELDCSPCKRGCKERRCLEGISVDEVFSKVKELL